MVYESKDAGIKSKLYRDKPLISVTLSEFEKPGPDYLTNLRRFCIAIGVINSGESRIAIVHIVDLLLKARKTSPAGLDSYAITEGLYKTGVKIVYANILRDLRKLITVGLVEKIDGKYRIRENMSISEILASFIKPYIIDKILNRLQEYAVAIDKE
jgi:hypothetical protein